VRERMNGSKNGGENIWQLAIVILTTQGVHQQWKLRELWKRSVELHNIRYKWMVSDGDSKVLHTLENVYSDSKVMKLDCVSHIQKRMGKHLTNLRARTKGKLADGKPIGGQADRLKEESSSCKSTKVSRSVRILSPKQIHQKQKLMLLFMP